MRAKTHFSLILDLFNGKANGRDGKFFNSIEEAKEYWKKEYRDRNKGDGHDEYWNKVSFRVQQTITIDFWDK